MEEMMMTAVFETIRHSAARTALTVAGVVWLGVSAAVAQTNSPAAGHWEGNLQAPNRDIPFAIDIAPADAGFTGTIDLPESSIKGLPVSALKVDGTTVSFILAASGGGQFKADLGGDGRTMLGDLVADFGTVPFSLTRTANAHITAPPRSAGIAAALDGTWTGTLDAGGRQLRLQLKVIRQSDATVLATIVSLDEDGLEVPAGITQNGAAVTLDLPAVGATFSGTLAGDAHAIAGSYAQHGVSMPITLTR